MSEVSNLPVLFIGGIGRSGSTVFELSLGTDERVVALGEVLHLWQRSLLDRERCGCGAAFSECAFWRSVGERAFGGWDQIDPGRVLALKRRIDRTVRTPQLSAGIGTAAWKADVREYASYYSRLYRAAAAVSGRRVIVDSSKQASLPYVLRHADGLDVRVLHCVRDSRAVAYSWTKKVSRPESQHDGAQLMTRYSPPVLALKWMQHNTVIEALRFQGVPTKRIRYEDWVAAPVATVQAALRFGGLEPRQNPLLHDQWVELPVNHTCSGNPMRFTQGRVDIRIDEQWRTALPATSRRVVTGLTAPGLVAYGYFDMGGRWFAERQR